MFFLFFGYGTKVKVGGEAAERTCPNCHNTTRWRHLERYRYVSLFFVRWASLCQMSASSLAVSWKELRHSSIWSFLTPFMSDTLS